MTGSHVPGAREPGLHVRSATPADARCIAQVHVQSWDEAHRGRVPAALSDRVDLDLSTLRWGARLRGETPAGGERLGPVWVALAAERVVGFASAGPTRDDDLDGRDVELYALYVLAAHHGSGAGAALLHAAIGDAPASVWVVSDNPRAHAFYAKHSFAPDGVTRRDERFGEPLDEVRLVR